MTMILRAWRGTFIASSCLLAACHQPGDGAANQMAGNTAAMLPALPASEPMVAGPVTPPVIAPQVASLPRAPRPALRRLAGPAAGYAYLDRAASYDDAVGQAPPDYSFGYDGVNPWGWQADDGSVEYAEPISGGYRYYYYQPGADTPYLVRDPSYSYAYDGAALVLVYDRGGRPLPPDAYGPRRDYAGRYFARAQALRAAAQADRRGVVAADWAARRAEVAASNAAWDAARARDAAWTAYHARAADQQSAHWQAERDARTQATQRFATYQGNGFRGPPPAFGRDPGQPDRAGPPPQPIAAPPAAPSRPVPAAMPLRAQGAPRDQAVRSDALQHEQASQAQARQVQLRRADIAQSQMADARAKAARGEQTAAHRQDVARHEQQHVAAPRAAAPGRPTVPHPDRPRVDSVSQDGSPHTPPPRAPAEVPHHAAPQPHVAPPPHAAPPPRPAPQSHAEHAPRPAPPPHAAPPAGGPEREHH